MTYSQRLLQQGNPLTRLAHRSRFSAVLNLLGNTKYQQALDYGCGDGWLLKTAYEQGIISSGIGIDLADYMLSACQEMFREIPGFKFCKPEELSKIISPQTCDLIFCTETLEHIGNAENAVTQILTYCQPGATMIISVPIEIGPSLLLKQIGRYLANLKGNYGYEKYTLRELFAASILWNAEKFVSSHSLKNDYTGHKGFDYRKIEKLLEKKVKIQQRIFSPFPWGGNLLNSTVIWVCRVENT
ncbi:class I SAM-dependent methyltransferase [Aerosakkonemataceae cyanobacterium BLCC-F154]|uniref:Class I SAM-dependent methyltransferase n=1 Tax=Floridaenema fluviatile BLCC-F154 TaxID=3153640 RepID=A0ABV4YA75_9CYAN